LADSLVELLLDSTENKLKKLYQMHPKPLWQDFRNGSKLASSEVMPKRWPHLVGLMPKRWPHLVGLLPRDFRRAGAVLEESQAPPFFMKNDFYKMFGKATSKKPEPVYVI